MTFKLADVCTIKYGKDHKHLSDGNIPVYGSGGVMRYADTAIYGKKSVLIPRKGTLDNLFFVSEPFWTVDTLFYTEIDESKAVPEYLYYLLKTLDLAGMNVGTAVPSLTTAVLNEIEIDLPPISEQQTIADTLSVLDERITENKKINHHLEQIAQAIFINFLGSAVYPSVGCCTAQIGDWLQFINGFAFKSSTYLDTGKYKIITIKNVQDGSVDSSGASCLDELPAGINTACRLAFGDVLLSLTGNVGRVGIVTEDNLLLNQRVAKFDPITKGLLPYWYFLFRQSEMKDHLINIAKGTAQQNLSPVETLKTEIAFNESDATKYAEIVSPMFWAIAENCKEITRLAKLRDVLLLRLMSGELSIADLGDAK